MALIVGITGGIGSGKTTTCRIFEVLGARVFYADDEAKALYSADDELKREVINAFGAAIYLDGIFSKENLASIVFGDAEKLETLNGLVHPALARAFASWCEEHSDQPYLLKEAAILIESGAYKACDEVIVVTCPDDLRVARVVYRDGISREDVLKRMRHQLSESERREYSTIEIDNSGSKPMTPQVLDIHRRLIEQVETR